MEQLNKKKDINMITTRTSTKCINYSATIPTLNLSSARGSLITDPKELNKTVNHNKAHAGKVTCLDRSLSLFLSFLKPLREEVIM